MTARRTSASSRLAAYHRKRDLARSGEPGSERSPARKTRRRSNAAAASADAENPPVFVIQKHAATRLHYDLRLEMEGVMRSWAVPKGLPAQTGRKVLAIEVEDHPMSYNTFEGVIPAGNYGAGTVMIWDRGHYLTASDDPAAAHRKGHLDFALVGEKCTGNWTLTRMRHAEDDQQWLLIKRSEPRRRAVIKRDGRDRSVVSGRTLAEIKRDGASD